MLGDQQRTYLITFQKHINKNKMENHVKWRISMCHKHSDRIAELHCKSCDKQLCVECSLDHNPDHKVLLHTQEAIHFARSVVNKSFSVKEEEKNGNEVLENFANMKNEYEGIDKLFKQAAEKLDEFDNHLGREIKMLKEKTGAISDNLDYLKTINGETLVEQVKGFLSQGDYQRICQKKIEFSKIRESRDELANRLIKQMTVRSQRKKRTLQAFVDTFDEAFKEIPKKEPVIAEMRLVGIVTNRILIYDLIKQRKRILKPKNVKFHKYCEGIEVGQSLFLIGGKHDNTETYEICLNSYDGNFLIRADMNKGRCNHALCQLSQKAIYCAGGVHGSTALDTCEKYNIEEDTWQLISSLNEAKHNGAMCGILDRYIYYFGGGKIGHIELSTKIEVLDTAKGEMGEWDAIDLSTINPNWTPCECLNVAAIGKGEIMIFGGWETNKDSRSATFIYNHYKKELTKLPSCMKRNSAFFYRITPAYHDGKIYAMSPDEHIHTFYLKNREWGIIENEEWKERFTWDESKKPIITGRIHSTLWIYEASELLCHTFFPKNREITACCEGAVVGMKIFLVGGKGSSKETSAIDICSYKGEVEIKANLHIGRYNHALEKVAGAYIYCCGGYSNQKLLSHCEKYSISQDKWYVIPPLTETKQNLSLCNFSDRMLYSIGGGEVGHQVVYSTIEKLNLHNEEEGWKVVPIFGTGIPPMECIGSVQVSAHGILLFGGWKPGRKDSGKCYEFDVTRQRITRITENLKNKSGFYYLLKPVVAKGKVYIMDPDFNVNIYDKFRKEWDIIAKREWKSKEHSRKDEGCAVAQVVI
eukprot:TRINITY_DN188_c0_g1_i1.p2 TRINITY_DN188_c0_g1~~TRINITY_DN188_c0_g1_i1.p2  ORF type:complete len:813 (+),score=88.22 TRINITY_DN188_c0_g1_i1:2688-5126(+)